MNGIGLLVLLALVRAYYRRKWEGAHLGAPLDLGWILKRVRPEVGLGNTIISCWYEKPRLVFLVQDGDTLEWHFYRHSVAHGWIRG